MNNENPTHPAPVHVEPTEELAARLFVAQLVHTKATIESYLLYPGSDDGRDYLEASLDLSHDMAVIEMGSDMSLFHQLLNRPNQIFNNYACDGVANEFYELNCPGAPLDLDFYDSEENPA